MGEFNSDDQGASHVVPGKSDLHARGEGERVWASLGRSLSFRCAGSVVVAQELSCPVACVKDYERKVILEKGG